jgi:hypothetical protein
MKETRARDLEVFNFVDKDFFQSFMQNQKHDDKHLTTAAKS